MHGSTNIKFVASQCGSSFIDCHSGAWNFDVASRFLFEKLCTQTYPPPTSHLHNSLNVQPIPVLIHPLTDKLFAHCPSLPLTAPHTPNPPVQQIRNYTLADRTNLYKRYKHNRTKHILLELAYRKSQRFLYGSKFFTAVICTYIYIYIYIYIHIIQFHLYHSVNIYWNWLQKQFCNLSFYTLCILSLQ